MEETLTDYELASTLPPITVDVLKRGFMLGDVRIGAHCDACGGTVCIIRDNWFYFGGFDADEEEPFEFVTNHDPDEILRDIADVLFEFQETEPTEWLYYYYVLRHE